MMQVNTPVENFFDVDGTALDDGYVYVGQSGLNPETHPQALFWDKAGAIPAAQPIRTRNGYPFRDGAAAKFYTATAFYSITVRNKTGALVFSSLNTDSGIFDELAASAGASNVGYDNAVSGLAATDVQAGIDELKQELDSTAADIDSLISGSSAVVNLFANSAFNFNSLDYVSGTPTTTANETTLDMLRVVVSGQSLTFSAGDFGNAITAPAGGLEQVIAAGNITGGEYACSWVGSGTIRVNGIDRAKGEFFTLPENTAATVRMVGDFQRFVFTRPTMLGQYEYDFTRDFYLTKPRGFTRFNSTISKNEMWDGSAWVSEGISGAVTVSLTGTAVDLTGVPSFARRITCLMNGFSFTGTNSLVLQLGTSASVETTGYEASTVVVGSTSSATGNSYTTGFGVFSNAASFVSSGVLRLERIDSTNTWIFSGMTSYGANVWAIVGAGRKTLSGTLDRLRFGSSGADSFDAGSVTVRWEA